MTVKIIAEVGSNWNPVTMGISLRACIAAAAKAGADAVKFQDWAPIEDMARSDEWKSRCRPWTLAPEWHIPLQSVAEGYGVEVFCSVFTLEAVVRAADDLDRAIMREHLPIQRGAPIKLASSEIANQELLRCLREWRSPVRCKQTPRDIIVSLGEADSPFAVSTAISRLADYNITLMACVAEYPVKRPLDLLDSLTFAQQFGLPVGISSHIAYPGVLSIVKQAIKRGSTMVEAHLRVRGVTPPDAPDNGPWALWEDEFAELVRVVREADGVPSDE